VAVERRETESGKIRWLARYYDPTGREHAKTFDTKREADSFLAEQRAMLNTSKWIDPRAGTVRLAALWDQYSRDLLPQRRPTTRQNYRAAWRNVAPVLGAFPVGRLRHGDVQRFVTELKKGAETVRMAYRVLSLVLDYAVKNRYVSENVAKGVRLPAPRPPRERMLTRDQLLALADAVGPAGRGQVLMMALAGLRWSEMAALRVGGVDFDANRIHIVAGAPEAGGKIHLGSPKTKRSIRRVAIPRMLVEDLRERLEGNDPDHLVYPAPQGGFDRVGNFRRRVSWTDACAAAGVGHVTPHDLRRTYGSLANLGGANMRYIQDSMGHESIETTSRTYAHLYDTEPDQVAEGIDRVMNGGAGPPKSPEK
jgi:integrase